MVNGMLTNDDVRKLVEIMLLQSTQREAAGLLGVSTSYLNDYLHFRRDPGPALLDGLGLEKVTLYRFVSKPLSQPKAPNDDYHVTKDGERIFIPRPKK